ncbi:MULTISPECIES: BCCT family transporter [unclassified Pseudactinotalea]|uniref:BCCT family transporter n=1 Tax=unclassified Pseudactinotalea TaxID=2649176 RepID=UPI00128D3D97|nr:MULTISPECIES: BCCT family transporter [unclassified Pseudactinotalea]MPV49722.1 BCCT family transporter [Pseudactinotalea sp. HY160]QGH69605.1 BCCT family transporter [Pseudactinotalea sp. HY158]
MSESEGHTGKRGSRNGPVRRVIREVTRPSPGLIHPALIPGIGVERTGKSFSTNVRVFAIAGALVAGVILWAVVAPGTISSTGAFLLAWVTDNFGWLFGLLAIAIAGYMIVLGYGRTGGVRLGADDEEPEFSTVSWVAMLFSAGMGIGLLFYGPYEPLTYFLDPPHGMRADPGTVDAMHSAMAQTLLHWGPIAWAFYALVGGAIAYNAYRRGRSALISSIFEPIFGQRTRGAMGAVIDIFAIIVTLFGTAISLGIGALQIGQGYEVLTGAGPVTNTFLVAVMAALTAAFIVSAVSGVKRGIRALSNINMVVAGVLALFVFIAGPTVFLLNFIPAGIIDFFRELGTMLVRNPNEGPETAEFMAAWTTYYWAWWVSWTPFVGLFIAKISRGRTLREFVTVVIMVPAFVCALWFGIFGGTAMYLELTGNGISGAGSAEAMLFDMLGKLPFGAITSVLAMISIVVFFVTSADSASIVMGSMSQRGKPDPSKWVTAVWGMLLGGTAVALLLAGGQDALNGLQSLMMVSALPFAIIVIGIMIAWARDLHTDPYILRQRYARTAIAQGVRRAIADHGDDFVFESSEVDADEGAGAWLDTGDPALVEWYLEATGELAAVDAEDVLRTMTPGRIQPRGEPRPEHTASGERAMVTADLIRLERLRQAEERRRRDNGGSGRRDT